MIKKVKPARLSLFGLLATGAIALVACVPPEQAERRDGNDAIEASSRKITFSACYPVDDAETQNASSILATQGGKDAVYWWWRGNRDHILASVNAKASTQLTASCVQKISSACGDLGLRAVSGSVSRAQAAVGLGEFTVKCSPRLEQS